MNSNPRGLVLLTLFSLFTMSSPAASMVRADDQERTSSFFSGDSKSDESSSTWLKMPKMPWSKSQPKAKSPSMMSKVGSTSKRWWNNTVDFVNPFNDAEKPKPKQGFQSPAMRARAAEQEKKQGMFSWMWQEEEEREIKTVNDFLGMPMPE